MMSAKLPPPLHCLLGAEPLRFERRYLWLMLGGLVLLVVVLLLQPSLAADLVVLLRFVEPLAALGLVGALIYSAWRWRLRQKRAAAALLRAAAGDDFWHAGRLEATVLALFEPYWRALAAGNITPVAKHLSPFWAAKAEATLAAWLASYSRPVLLDLSLQRVSVVGLEDWLADYRDQVTVCVESTNSFHVTHLPSGKLVEGSGMARQQKELWQLVRGEQAWLLNRVEIIAEGASVPAIPIINEEH